MASPTFTLVAPDVYVAQALTKEEAAIVRDVAAATPGWAPGVINADALVDRAVRDADVLQADANPRLVGMCHQRLFAVTSERASALAPESTLSEMQFVRYAPGGGYVDHRDTPALGATPRTLSLVCYLNDDFEGGETVFRDGDVRVEPRGGRLVLFSPVLLHRAEPVRAGTKYAITAWYHAPAFSRSL